MRNRLFMRIPRVSILLSPAFFLLIGGLTDGLPQARADSPAGPNLVLNGSFDAWAPPSDGEPKNLPKLLSDAIPVHWSASQESIGGSGAVAKDATVKHDAAFSLRIENARPTDITEIDQQIAVEPDTKYAVRCWIKGQIDAKGGPIVWANTGPKTDFWNHQTANPQYPKIMSDDWQRFQFSFTTRADAGLLDLVLQLRSATGKVWFDDLQVVKSGTNPHVESY